MGRRNITTEDYIGCVQCYRVYIRKRIFATEGS
jgi:hypothetical protein